ncbi:class I SAM-dependent methyltransferase [Litchfieldia salsa]|uniref:Ubiquinone/menaquinone biosynthesis C-methylase UbiE n=1 Tax=Litchfieldia salsa TaxID=930152 RepID=A0A1H0TDT4_9BACI|nr:class I SAM-dependent methyltransferase [Litchfieldia salsa]SDP52213.1 Ubiquinone/menaquinone biosynthesis C-methylase UbiE [Litchfieldia salsa]
MNDYLEFLALFGVGGAHPGGFPLTKKILQEEGFSVNAKVLDIGCGTGQTAAHLISKYQCEVTAIDKHPIMINKAKKRFQTLGYTLQLSQEDAENLSFKNHQFDYVLSESVLSFTDCEKSLGEIKRVLTNDGVLIAIEMTNEENLSTLEMEEIKKFYGVKKILAEEEWKQLFIDSGFTNVSIRKADSLLTNLEEEFNNTEFQLSQGIPQSYVKIFDQHEELTNKYKHKLGFRIYRCII